MKAPVSVRCSEDANANAEVKKEPGPEPPLFRMVILPIVLTELNAVLKYGNAVDRNKPLGKTGTRTRLRLLPVLETHRPVHRTETVLVVFSRWEFASSITHSIAAALYSLSELRTVMEGVCCNTMHSRVSSWGSRRNYPPNEENTLNAGLRKGDAIIVLAFCFHRGSANMTDDHRLVFRTSVTRGWLRREEIACFLTILL